MKGRTPNNTTKERQYIKLSGEETETERLSFPDECFEDEDDFDYDDFLMGMDDEGARKAKKSVDKDRILGEVCFISGMAVVGAVLVGATIFVSRVFMYPLIKKFAKDLDW